MVGRRCLRQGNHLAYTWTTGCIQGLTNQRPFIPLGDQFLIDIVPAAKISLFQPDQILFGEAVPGFGEHPFINQGI